MVVLNGVSKVYSNGQKALDNINLDIRKGEFLFLSGSSGAGKTSLLELLLKEEEPTRGMIQVNGDRSGKAEGTPGIPLPSYDWDGFPGLPSFSRFYRI